MRQKSSGWLANLIAGIKEEVAKLGRFERLSILMAMLGEATLGITRPDGAALAAIWLILGTLIINLFARMAKID